MKNKEIEELLNNIKEQLIIDEKLGKEIAQDFHKTILNYEETKLLLSYIEQLEEDNILIKSANKLVSEKLEQLENNRNKAIEYCNNNIEFTPRLIDVIDILKGDSDE